MAEGIGAEVAALRPLDRLSAPPAQSSIGWDRIEADLVDAGGPRLAERAAAFERAAGLFERLTSHTDLAAEAHLRLGYVRLCQGQRDTALAHFDRVAALTEERRIRYLAHLYSGWILGGLGRVNEAVIAYRAALRFVPGAQSAATLLVALLTRNNQLDEAERMADEFLTGTEGVDDPWRTYFIGDFTAYPRLVRQLREALQ
jgi:tetratricopeptide (TPR) repeat protein